MPDQAADISGVPDNFHGGSNLQPTGGGDGPAPPPTGGQLWPRGNES